MANLNKVFLIGNLTRDPELRYTPSGTAVCDFGLAVNRRWRNRDGQQSEETLFVDVTAWARQAEIINQYCRRGSPVFIEGRLQLDTWQSQEGQKRSRIRVVVENMQLLGARGESPAGPPASRPPRPAARAAESAPEPPDEFQEPPVEDDAGFDTGEDDIPF